MSASGETTHYKLPYFTPNDLTTWGAFNQSMLMLDTILYTLSQTGGDIPDLGDINKAIEDINKNITELQDNLNNMENNIIELQTAIHTLQNAVSKNTEDIISHISKINDLENNFNSLSNQVQTQGENIANIDNNIDSLNLNINNFNKIHVAHYSLTEYKNPQYIDSTDTYNLTVKSSGLEFMLYYNKNGSAITTSNFRWSGGILFESSSLINISNNDNAIKTLKYSCPTIVSIMVSSSGAAKQNCMLFLSSNEDPRTNPDYIIPGLAYRDGLYVSILFIASNISFNKIYLMF